MTRDEIIPKINAALAAEFELPLEALKPDADFQALGLDSLDYIDMVIVLETAFGFRLPDKELIQKVRTVGDIYELIEKINNGEIPVEPLKKS